MSDPQTREEMEKYVLETMRELDEAGVKSVFITTRMELNSLKLSKSLDNLQQSIESMRKTVATI